MLFDSSLAHFITIVDTTSETAKAYGTNGGWLLPFTADSSLFADFAALSFLVIDPAGKIARQMAAPLGQGQQSGLPDICRDRSTWPMWCPNGRAQTRAWACLTSGRTMQTQGLAQ